MRHFGGSTRPSVGFRSAPAFAAAPHFGSRFGTSFGPGFRRPFVTHRRFVRRGFYSTFSPFYFGYYGYPTYYPDQSFSTLDSYPANENYAAYYAQNSDDLARQQRDIDRLEDEVARLHEPRASREANPPQAAEIASTPTLLIFRDKHTQEVQNYAVVGGTLWIFTEQRAAKLPLSWLDIEATTKANDERGVDFRLPN
jgi:hypothetical protein